MPFPEGKVTFGCLPYAVFPGSEKTNFKPLFAILRTWKDGFTRVIEIRRVVRHKARRVWRDRVTWARIGTSKSLVFSEWAVASEGGALYSYCAVLLWHLHAAFACIGKAVM